EDFMRQLNEGRLPAPADEGTVSPMSVTREEMKHALDATESRMAAAVSDLRAAISDMKSEVHKGTAELIKWVVGTGIAFITITIGILTFVINNAAKHPPSAASQTPPPIIINVPGQPPAPPAK